MNVNIYIHQGNLFQKSTISLWGFYDKGQKSITAAQKHGL